jgi:hypothetical protein
MNYKLTAFIQSSLTIITLLIYLLVQWYSVQDEVQQGVESKGAGGRRCDCDETILTPQLHARMK